MHGTDQMFGSFEFETGLKQLDNGWWEATGAGERSVHHNMEQAVNDLNAKIDAKIQRGELQPDITGWG